MSRLEEIPTGTKAWWSSRQDDFVKEVRGAGFDTHSLYDVPAALAEYTYNLESELAALREEHARLRGATEALLNWRKHPGHGGRYDIPKPMEPYLLQLTIALSPSPAKEQTK